MKRWVVVILVGLLVALLSAPASAQQNNWALTERLEISNATFGFQMSYPAGWLTDTQKNVTTIDQLEADQQQALDDDFAAQGYAIRFDYFSPRQLRQLGLQPADATPADLLQANAQHFGYQTTDISDTTLLAWPAAQERAVDKMGNTIVTIQGLMDGNGFELTLTAPSPQALDAFLPTWLQMLDSIQLFRGVVSVGDYNLNFVCKGEGSPTVILEIGWGGHSSQWLERLSGVSEFTRVCAIDRNEGIGLMVEQHTTDLHTVLTKAGIEGPYIIVGHSYGGFVARMYTHDYPGAVAGMVLVDSSQEDAGTAIAQFMTPDQLEQLQTEEASSDLANSSPVVAQPISLGDIPLVVLSAGVALPHPPLTDEQSEQFQKVWDDDLQARLAALSTDSTHIVVADASHLTIIGFPQVTDAIRKVVDEVRAKSN